MKLSRGALILVLLALAMMLIGLVQVIASSIGSNENYEGNGSRSSMASPATARIVACRTQVAGCPSAVVHGV